MASKGTICKFFAQGYCRYGDRCYYRHSSGGQGSGFGTSDFFSPSSNPFKLDNRYSALGSTSSNSSRSLFGGGNAASQQQTISEQISSICNEMQTWEQSGMWLFSSFYHSKDATCNIPGFEDYSQEELRHEAYSENPKPHLQINYKAKERQLFNDVKMKIASLKSPDAATKQQLTAFLRTARQGDNASSNTTPSSVFGGSASVSPSSTSAAPASGAGKTAEETLAAIGNEVSSWERSGMWLLSEYCSNKESPTIPGFKDISPDELRYEAYSENPKPHLQLNYKNRERNLINEARMRIGQLKNPDTSTKQQLIAFLTQTSLKATATTATSGGGLFGATTAPVQKALFGGAQPTSVFGGSPQATLAANTTTTSPFGNSTFGGTNNSTGGLFGKASASNSMTLEQTQSGLFASNSTSISTNTGLFGNPTAPSVFGGAAGTGSNSTGLFGKTDSGGTGLFGKSGDSSQTTATGLFGKAADSSGTSGLFGKAADSPATSGLFGKAVDSTSTSGLFGKAQTGLFGSSPAGGSVFGNMSTPVVGLTQDQPVQASEAATISHKTNSIKSLPLYTPLEELTEAERAQFEAAKFTLGRIPTRPPAKEYV